MGILNYFKAKKQEKTETEGVEESIIEFSPSDLFHISWKVPEYAFIKLDENTLCNAKNKANLLESEYKALTEIEKNLQTMLKGSLALPELHSFISFVLANGKYKITESTIQGTYLNKSGEAVTLNLALDKTGLKAETTHFSTDNRVNNSTTSVVLNPDNKGGKTISTSHTNGSAIFNVNTSWLRSKSNLKPNAEYQVKSESNTYDEMGKLVSDSKTEEQYFYLLQNGLYQKYNQGIHTNLRHTTTRNFVDKDFTLYKNIEENDFPNDKWFKPLHFEYHNIACSYPRTINKMKTYMHNLISKEQYEDVISKKRSLMEVVSEREKEMIASGDVSHTVVEM